MTDFALWSRYIGGAATLRDTGFVGQIIFYTVEDAGKAKHFSDARGLAATFVQQVEANTVWDFAKNQSCAAILVLSQPTYFRAPIGELFASMPALAMGSVPILRPSCSKFGRCANTVFLDAALVRPHLMVPGGEAACTVGPRPDTPHPLCPFLPETSFIDEMPPHWTSLHAKVNAFEMHPPSNTAEPITKHRAERAFYTRALTLAEQMDRNITSLYGIWDSLRIEKAVDASLALAPGSFNITQRAAHVTYYFDRTPLQKPAPYLYDGTTQRAAPYLQMLVTSLLTKGASTTARNIVVTPNPLEDWIVSMLDGIGVEVVVIPKWTEEDYVESHVGNNPSFRVCFDKLTVWTINDHLPADRQLDVVILSDLDYQPRVSLDHLFPIGKVVGGANPKQLVGSFDMNWLMPFNGGFYVLTPNTTVYNDMRAFFRDPGEHLSCWYWNVPGTHTPPKTWFFGEQEALYCYYATRLDAGMTMLPVTYNQHQGVHDVHGPLEPGRGLWGATKAFHFAGKVGFPWDAGSAARRPDGYKTVHMAEQIAVYRAAKTIIETAIEG